MVNAFPSVLFFLFFTPGSIQLFQKFQSKFQHAVTTTTTTTTTRNTCVLSGTERYRRTNKNGEMMMPLVLATAKGERSGKKAKFQFSGRQAPQKKLITHSVNVKEKTRRGGRKSQSVSSVVWTCTCQHNTEKATKPNQTKPKKTKKNPAPLLRH